MSDNTKRVLLGLTSVGIAIFMFILADAAMPDEVKWFMRWWLAGVALVCYFVGAAYAAYLMRERHAETLKGMQAALDNERRKNAELAARVKELESEERRKLKEREEAERRKQQQIDVAILAIRSLPSQQRDFLKSAYDKGMTDCNASYEPMLSLAEKGYVIIGSKGFGSPYVTVEVAHEVRAFIAMHYDELFSE